MQNFRRIAACRICGNTNLVPILSLGEQYLTGIFPRTIDELLTRGPLNLVKCDGGAPSCGLVQLQHSYVSSEMYGDRYGYRSSLNQSMVTHLRAKVASLIDIASPAAGDIVLDIGSNDGTTLSFYPDSLTRLGMDPTAEKFSRFYAPGVRYVADFFSADRFDSETGGGKATIVTSIAMFYDLDDPLSFVEQVCRVLADDGIWHLEQSYMPKMLETNGYDTICHEHVEYYALSQIDWMMKRAGLRIIDVELNEVNGGSFAVTVCKEAARYGADREPIDAVLAAERALFGTLAPFHAFAERVERHRDELPALLADFHRDGRVTLGYGASTKGNVMLQYCGLTQDEIPFVAEVNEEKFGAFTPGSLIPIIPEREAHAMMPDCFLVMPWHFRSNLLAREKTFVERGGRMIFPLPDIDVVARPRS